MASSSPATPEPVPAQTFAPFPLRARGNMEIFDAAIKLYKQYFWVLLGWSAIVTGAGLIAATSCGGLISFFLSPLFIGAVSCCIAAAVRGQQVTFNQCWKFTQPRYGAILGMYILASIIGALACGVAFGVGTAIFVAGAYALTGASTAVQITMALLGILVLGTIVAIVCTVFVTWVALVPIVVCLEEDKRNSQALGRAYELLRGRWVSVTALMTVVGLSGGALMLVLTGFGLLLMGPAMIKDLMAGATPNPSTMMVMLIGFFSSFSLIGILFTPLYNLIVAVYYLDLRVRKEALDLEWAAHTTAPQTPPASPDNTGIAPDESWQAQRTFVPEYSSAPQPPAAPTATVQAANTIDYPPHATRQLDDNDKLAPLEYSGAALESPDAASEYSGAESEARDETQSDETLRTDDSADSALPFSDLPFTDTPLSDDMPPDSASDNEPRRW